MVSTDTFLILLKLLYIWTNFVTMWKDDTRKCIMDATLGNTTQLCRVTSSALALNDNKSPAKLKKLSEGRDRKKKI